LAAGRSTPEPQLPFSTLFPLSIALRWLLLSGNSVKGSDADPSLSEQVSFSLVALLDLSYRAKNVYCDNAPPHDINHWATPLVEDTPAAIDPSPRSLTTPEAFNRYFRS
jgi:hypothetical protein